MRKAYHKLARVHHPDKARTADEREAAESRFKEIGAAYELLSDPERRAEFDEHGFDPNTYRTPAEADEEERHARRMYCAAMGIPETVVREVWCTMEELFAGATKREGVVVHVLGADSGVPEKQAKVFTVRVRPGCEDKREIRFGAMHTNNLQSVAFVVRERPHSFFERASLRSPDDASRLDAFDIRARVALTPEQFEQGTTLVLPTLTGNTLKLKLKPRSAVARAGGVKVVKGEGFPMPAGDGDDDGGGGDRFERSPRAIRMRGDLRVSFRVMSRFESRARFCFKTYARLYETSMCVRIGSWAVSDTARSGRRFARWNGRWISTKSEDSKTYPTLCCSGTSRARTACWAGARTPCSTRGSGSPSRSCATGYPRAWARARRRSG